MLNSYFFGFLASNSKKYYKKKPSVTKGCKTKQVEVQIPSSKKVNELTLSEYNSLICYKLSDVGVSRLGADERCPELLKT